MEAGERFRNGEPLEDVELGEIRPVIRAGSTMHVHIIFIVITIHLPIAIFDLISAYSSSPCYYTQMNGNLFFDMHQYLMVSGYVWIILCTYYLFVYVRYGTHFDYAISLIGEGFQLLGVFMLFFWNILAVLLVVQMVYPKMIETCNLKLLEYLYLTVSIKTLSSFAFMLCYQCCRDGQQPRIFVDNDEE